ncbi:MAG: hypothetical protein N3G20_10510, partial [Verrucomicrobiae bacterium]|nr:hypothetical protein [Verrucomicrobiae bacterium]
MCIRDRVKGTIHWVSASHAVQAEVRLYDRLFTVPEPDAAGGKLTDHLNPTSLEVVSGWVEPSLRDARPEERYQFERLGYFCLDVPDPIASGHESPSAGRLVFNRTITLRDSWAKEFRKRAVKES